MSKTSPRLRKRRIRRSQIRRKIAGTAERPRLSVFRSARHIYAQVIDDTMGRTLAAASTLEQAVREQLQTSPGNKQSAQTVGKVVAERAVQAGVKRVVFDRGGNRFHGRVKALADSAREAGLEF